MGQIPNKIADRYLIREPLGQGGMGDVYRCIDTKTQTELAIKTLRNSQHSQMLWRFQREFYTMQNLAHPCCPKVFAYGSVDDLHYFTMEYVRGTTWEEQKADVLPLSLQLFAALDHLHSKNIIHRDLKPQNILVDPRGPRLVLIDYGIAHLDNDDEQHTVLGGIIGTMRYLSPEQAEGRVVDVRADLYSAGLLLYEALLGRYPYTLSTLSPTNYLTAHLSQAAISPLQLQPDFPPRLSDLLLSLLAKTPFERPTSAAEVFEILKEFVPRDRWPSFGCRRILQVFTPKFVGQKALLSSLQHCTSPLAILYGEAGIGKSRILEQLFFQLRSQGRLSLLASCQESQQVPYLAWSGLLARIERTLQGTASQISTQETILAEQTVSEDTEQDLPQLPNENFFWSSETQRQSWQSQLCALRAKKTSLASSRELQAISHVGPILGHWNQLRQIADMICAYIEKFPCTLLWDDVHHIDPESIELLQFVLAANPNKTISIYMSARSFEVMSPAQQQLQELLVHYSAQQETIPSLSVEDCGALVASALGDAPIGPSLSLAAQLSPLTQNNPQHIMMLLRTWLAEGLLTKRHGTWNLQTLQAQGLASLSQSMQNLLLQRVSQLSVASQNLLVVFAAMGNQAPLALLRECASLTPEESVYALEELLSSALIREVTSQEVLLCFQSDILRTILYEQLSDVQKRLLHQRIAQITEARPNYLEFTARQWLLAGETDLARQLFLQAGNNALRNYEGARAARCYEEVCKLQNNAQHQERLGKAYEIIGDLDHAELAYRTALTENTDKESKTRLLRNLAEVLRKRGNLKESAHCLEEAMGLYGKTLPKTRGGVLGSIVSQGLLRVAHNVGIKGSVKESERESTALLASLAASLTHVLYYVDYDKSTASHLLMLNTAEKLGPSDELASAWLYHGAALVTIGDADNAQKFLAQGRKMAEERKANPLIERAGAYETWLDWTQGKVRQAATRAEELIAKKPPKDPFDLATLLYVAAAARTAMGELEKVSPHLRALERLAEETRSVYTRGTARLHTGIWLLAGGNAFRAEQRLQEARQFFVQSGGQVYATAALSFLGKSLLVQGKIPEALGVLTTAAEEVEIYHLRDPLVQVPFFLAEVYLAKADMQTESKAQKASLSLAAQTSIKAAQLSKNFPFLAPLSYKIQSAIARQQGKKELAEKLWKQGRDFAAASELFYENR